MTASLKAYILDSGARSNANYTAWLPSLSVPHQFVDSYGLDWTPPDDAGIVISLSHYCAPEASILRRVTAENRVPVLILADGILEYRNTFEHPALVPGAVFQPVLGHKLACIGRSQARIVESWGGLGQCEIVGLPRLDIPAGQTARRAPRNKPFQILIATAREPAFTAEQRVRVKQSLYDLKTWFGQHPFADAIEQHPVWRLTGGLADELLDGDDRRSDCVLAEALQSADALITTPSTTMLEGMLQRLPVALLDYNLCPHYVPAAWEIRGTSQMGDVVTELTNPPEAKMLFQETTLHDALECRTPATRRMCDLVQEMLRIGHRCREAREPLRFPKRILADKQEGHHLPERRFDPAVLYPDQRVFANRDMTSLQIENDHLKRLVNRQQAEIAAQHEALAGFREWVARWKQHPLAGPALRFRRRFREMWARDHRQEFPPR